MSRRALLVGINDYSQPEWALKGCIDDTVTMESLLRTYFGFQEPDIRLLHDQDATKQGICEGLSWLLTDYNGDGTDVRIFQFSGHGTQIDDQNGDEWDYLDEVIVPYDHDWNKPFRDDDLKAIFDEIPPNVNFTFIADCCHSGSIQKALLDSGIEFRSRSLVPPETILERIEARRRKRDQKYEQLMNARLQEMIKDVPPHELAVKLPDLIKKLRSSLRENKFALVEADRHILLAGCEDRQTAPDAFIEGGWHGAFTWAMAKAIREADGDLTYEQLIIQAGGKLREFDQRPQLECPKAMRGLRVFGPL